MQIYGDHHTFRNMRFGIARTMLFLYGENNKIENCEFYDCYVSTIYVQSDRNTIVGNIFRARTGTVNSDPSISAQDGFGIIENNVFEAGSNQVGSMINLYGHDYAVKNNSFKDLKYNAITFSGSNTIFEGNQFNFFDNKFKYYGILGSNLDAEQENVVYDDNVFCNGLSLTNLPVAEKNSKAISKQ